MTKTKRIWAVLLAACVFFTIISAAALADEVKIWKCGENLTGTYDETTKTLTISGTGDMRDYSPHTGNEHVPWDSFKNGIETVNIESGVTRVGEYAFYCCRNLKNITIPDSVTGIGERAFELTAYYEDDSKWENGVLYIGNHLIEADREISGAYSIKSGTKTIADSAFSSCDVTSVTVPDSVTSIGRYAFYFCDSLTSITIPDSVTRIGENAFLCTGMYNDDSTWDALYIGNHLIKVENYKLEQDNISNFTVKARTKTIAEHAFSACNKLTSITLPDSITSIGSHAFDSCGSLTSITIPKSVTSIGNSAFNTCYNLKSINVDHNNPAYCSKDGVLYNKTKTEIVRLPCETNTSFTIPSGVTRIADGAFEFCKSLKNITVPDGVLRIGNSAFERCENLMSITIPDSVTSIGDSVFLGCLSLTGITIPDGVMEIGYRTFYNCLGLTSVTIPNSVLIIDKEAFKNCIKLRDVYYIGSKTDWENVTGEGKNDLNNKIKRLSGISARFDGEKIVIKPCNIAVGKTVVLALYGGERGDRLVELLPSGDYGESKTEITFTPTQSYTRAKVMIWESLNDMTPVCGVKNVK